MKKNGSMPRHRKQNALPNEILQNNQFSFYRLSNSPNTNFIEHFVEILVRIGLFFFLRSSTIDNIVSRMFCNSFSCSHRGCKTELAHNRKKALVQIISTIITQNCWAKNIKKFLRRYTMYWDVLQISNNKNTKIKLFIRLNKIYRSSFLAFKQKLIGNCHLHTANFCFVFQSAYYSFFFSLSALLLVLFLFVLRGRERATKRVKLSIVFLIDIPKQCGVRSGLKRNEANSVART